MTILSSVILRLGNVPVSSMYIDGKVVYGSVSDQLKAIFTKYGAGTNSHMWLPGAGVPVLGPELVVGQFAVPGDYSNTLSSVTSSSFESTANGASNARVYADFATTIGTTYTFSFYQSSSSNVTYVRAGSSGNGTILYTAAAGEGLRTATFVAASTTTNFLFTSNAGFAFSTSGITCKGILSYTSLNNGFSANNYLDAAGTTPASTDGLGGLVLDAAGSVGSELVSATYSGIASSLWAVSSSSITRNGSLVGDARLTLSEACKANATYRVSVTVSNLSGDSIVFRLGGASGSYYTITTNGTFSFHGVGVGTSTYLQVAGLAGTAGQATITNISVKEITGIHASQATPGAKPIERRGIVNLLTWSNDLTNAAWDKNGVTPSGNTCTISTTSERARELASVVAGGAYTFAFLAKRGTMVNAKLSVYNQSAGTDIIAATSYYSEINGTDYTLVVRAFTAPVGCTQVYVYPFRDSGVTGTTLLNGIGLFQGTLTAAQILAYGGIPLTTTAAASSTLGPQYLAFAGDDYLTMPTSPLGSVITAPYAAVFSGRIGTLGGNKFLFGDGSVALGFDTVGKIRASHVGVNAVIGVAGLTANQPFVATYRYDGSGGIVMRVNGATEYAGALGAPTAAKLAGALGQSSAVGVPGYWDGHIACALVLNSTFTDAEIATMEAYAARCAGGRLVAGAFVSDF